MLQGNLHFVKTLTPQDEDIVDLHDDGNLFEKH